MLLVDVREPNETAVESYPDAVVVPLSASIRAHSRSAGKEVVFACRSGKRSVTASLRAQERATAMMRISPAASSRGKRRPSYQNLIPRRRALMLIRTAAVLAAALIAGALSADAQDKRVVNVYNWSDYIAPDVLKEFTREPASR
jgi:hypothetical protein